MANHQVDGSPGGGATYSTKDRAGQVASAGTSTYPSSLAVTNTEDIQSMRARLTAISATAYSSANLDAMTLNDMIYALRTADDPDGF